MPQNVPSGWAEANNALSCAIPRADFVEALAYVIEVGRLAEWANHHPEIDIRYKTVHLRLTTHSAGNRITAKDFALAQQINELDPQAIRLTRDELLRRFAARS